jgi:hypothetical protein
VKVGQDNYHTIQGEAICGFEERRLANPYKFYCAGRATKVGIAGYRCCSKHVCRKAPFCGVSTLRKGKISLKGLKYKMEEPVQIKTF